MQHHKTQKEFVDELVSTTALIKQIVLGWHKRTIERPRLPAQAKESTLRFTPFIARGKGKGAITDGYQAIPYLASNIANYIESLPGGSGACHASGSGLKYKQPNATLQLIIDFIEAVELGWIGPEMIHEIEDGRWTQSSLRRQLRVFREK